MLLAVVAVLLLQSQATPTASPGPAPRLRTVTATRAAVAPEIDGREDDAVWEQAPRMDQFREARPTEDGEPQQRTAFQVAYDAHHLYVFVRAFDAHPDSIVRLLSRRDAPTASDQIGVFIDSYHDRRTGYEFRVNPAGVKADYAIYNDGNSDDAWDAVWDVATRVDSAGWTAEYRIPLSQLRFAAAPEVTFGFAVWRTLQRHTALITWPLNRVSESGMVSQFGELTGLRDLATPRRAEIAPYLLTRNASRPAVDGFSRNQAMQFGGDLKYGVASNLTLNATVNPDFGQVEADPAVLNLSAFETFFGERRPFFVEGAGLFDFRANCFAVVDCRTGEGLFYTRRIGRAPELAGRYGDAQSPTATRILGAAKLTGRLPGGLSIGLLDAVTDRVGGVNGATIEPRSNYAVLRLNQDYAA
ncbi:MAG: carbohydrate binding family 9 domain-containing protein, partial [Gemmatimonadales bacterium]|nr:carbohydrate binding family 9 domain-containing protein [Gemmatimonadales bacterium]